MNTALVTAIGSFSADAVIGNLKENNYCVIGCDIYPREWIANASMVDRFYDAPLAVEQNQYMNFIKEVCTRERVNYVIPLTDVEVDVLNLNRKWFEENNIHLCISSNRTIELCRNKDKMAVFTAELDCVNTIPTFAMKGAGKDIPAPFEGFPLICKPVNGRSSQGICRIHSRQEWHNFCNFNDIDNYIVQPCIKGSVVTVDIVRQADGARTVAIPRQEMLRTLNGAGTSVYVFSDEMLQHACVELANRLQIIGCVNFEFIKDPSGNYHFIECNPRFSGGVAFSCVAGYDCISNHIAAFTGREIEELKPFRNQYIVKKYHEHVTCIE